MLSIEQLYFGYPGRNLFTQLNLNLPAGVTWIQGNNGTGKSTLLRLLCGATTASVGKISCDGTVLSQEPLQYKHKVFWMGPEAPAFDHLTAQEFWRFMAGLYNSINLSEAAQLCHTLQFEQFQNTPIKQLSSGNQRKTWLIAALSVHCQITLLDEPFNALDATAQMFLNDFLIGQCAQHQRLWVLTGHQLSSQLTALVNQVAL
jgi:ABC-2 type transport system ATP-binding protein